MVTSCLSARCSAIARQWLSDPPAMSLPKRWITQASFTGYSASAPIHHRGHQGNKGTVLRGLSFESIVVARRAADSLLPLHFSAKLRVLDRELLETGHHNPIDVLLPAEILFAVLEQPAHQWQKESPLHEDNDRAEHRPVAGEFQRGRGPPCLFVGQKLGEQQHVAIAPVGRAPE